MKTTIKIAISVAFSWVPASFFVVLGCEVFVVVTFYVPVSWINVKLLALEIVELKMVGFFVVAIESFAAFVVDVSIIDDVTKHKKYKS